MFRVVVHPKFDAIIMLFIIFNTFVMCLEHYRMSEGYVHGLCVCSFPGPVSICEYARG